MAPLLLCPSNTRDHGGKLSNVMIYFLRRKTQSQGLIRPNASDSQSHSFFNRYIIWHSNVIL